MGLSVKGFANVRGITLLELLIAIAIVIILINLGYTSFKHLKANYDLRNATNQLYADLQWVRQKSMGSANLYGIAFENKKYTVFKDVNDNHSYDADTDIIIKAETFKNISLSGYPASVLYSRRGTPNHQFTITLTNQVEKTKQIIVSQFKVRIQ